MRHLWDKIDDTCKRCGLKREIEYIGDGFIGKVSYKFFVNEKWTLNLPECTSEIKGTYDKLFDYNRLK